MNERDATLPGTGWHAWTVTGERLARQVQQGRVRELLVASGGSFPC
jgi:hypothetical protein